MNKRLHYIFLPSEKPSYLFGNDDGTISICKELTKSDGIGGPMHLYILSDDEIKEGDYFYNTVDGAILNRPSLIKMPSVRKIIATTNPELWNKEIKYTSGIEDHKEKGLPSISQSDIEYIISLYNGKGESICVQTGKPCGMPCCSDCGVYNRPKEFDVDKLALEKYPIKNIKGAGTLNGQDYDFNRQAREIFIQGFKANQCLQENADSLRDILVKFVTEYKLVRMFDDGDEEEYRGTTMEDVNGFIRKQFITSSKPKNDTVTVIYKKEVAEENYTPVIHDGCIVIIKD